MDPVVFLVEKLGRKWLKEAFLQGICPNLMYSTMMER